MNGVLSDLRRALSVIAPADIPYAHDAAWVMGTGGPTSGRR
ncbi:protein of unknown function [Methanoculleus bourgensis]|uniref:Uncharacterized protein n=1 Tax=Methanoculleus bourgensis TaxID=83986 RepID=A0A0X3BKQ2_9EURY|nr:protein of unknown function [Methanoculleus bourgensis]